MFILLLPLWSPVYGNASSASEVDTLPSTQVVNRDMQKMQRSLDVPKPGCRPTKN
jgi:hypothetical protein